VLRKAGRTDFFAKRAAPTASRGYIVYANDGRFFYGLFHITTLIRSRKAVGTIARCRNKCAVTFTLELRKVLIGLIRICRIQRFGISRCAFEEICGDFKISAFGKPARNRKPYYKERCPKRSHLRVFNRLLRRCQSFQDGSFGTMQSGLFIEHLHDEVPFHRSNRLHRQAAALHKDHGF
jgi:hypothetical protein